MDKPLHRMDHIMWNVETPTSLVTITGMMFLNEPVSKERLSTVIEERLLKYERFHKKIVTDQSPPVWHVDENFDLRSHIHHIALPAPGGYTELQEVISDLISQPLDYSKPLWQVHLIDNYNGGHVILWRLHHAIADGIALIKVVFSLTGTTREDSLNPDIRDALPEPEKHPKHSLKEDLEHWWHTGTEMYQEAKHLLQNPAELKDSLSDSWNSAKEMAGILSSPSLEGTIYKGQLGVYKKVAWSKPFPLDVVRQIGKLYQATINDVLLSIVSGALRRHMILHDAEINAGLRVVCPVNMRKKDELVKVHNKVAMMSFELPVHIADPKERMVYIKEKTTLLKHSWEPMIIYNLLNVIGDVIPKKWEVKMLDFVGNIVAGVITNVPGPKHAIYIAGAKVEDMMFWVPQTGPLGIGISIISYDNKVYLGLSMDKNISNDPDKVVEGFFYEFEILENLLKQAGHPEK